MKLLFTFGLALFSLSRLHAIPPTDMIAILNNLENCEYMPEAPNTNAEIRAVSCWYPGSKKGEMKKIAPLYFYQSDLLIFWKGQINEPDKKFRKHVAILRAVHSFYRAKNPPRPFVEEESLELKHSSPSQ